MSIGQKKKISKLGRKNSQGKGFLGVSADKTQVSNQLLNTTRGSLLHFGNVLAR
jgi:hypothetical protein